MSSINGTENNYCEREPIHIPGSIQPHGVLFILDQESLRIQQVSANCSSLFGIPPEKLLQQKFIDLLSVKEAEDFLTRFSQKRLSSHDPLILETATGTWCGFFHVLKSQRLAVEVELCHPTTDTKSIHSVLQCLERIQDASDLTELCQGICDSVRSLTHHDRVMVYRFNEDWHGEVVAESKNDEAYPYTYQGHHFPASDIPKQARDVFLSNWLRMIPDATYEPVPLVPVHDPETQQPVDLGQSMLRSVSPVHLRYLKNMDVEASLTITLKHEGRLWGLIACHHSAERMIDYKTRSYCEMIGRMASALIGAKIAISDYALKEELRSIYDQLLSYMSQEEDIIAGLVKHSPNLLNLTRSQGAAAAIYFEGQWTLIGKTPDLLQIENLTKWLSDKMSGKDIFHTDSLTSLFPEAIEYRDVASGILAISIPKGERNFILWFRPEVAQVVKWAGDPQKQIETLPDGTVKIEPRHSFESWKELVHLRSLPWKNPEIEAALELRSAIIGLDLQRQFILEQKARNLAEEATKHLAVSEAKLRALVEVAPQMFFIANAKGEVTYYNDRFYDFCGINEFNKIGGESWKVGNIHHPEDLDRTILTWHQAVITGNPYQIEYRLRRHDGQFRWHLGRAVAVRDHKGNIQQWFGTNTDIHDQKIIEEERREQTERFTDLMKRSKESAEAANEAKSTFLANMSHEIRTPLGAIMGFMELLKSPDVDAQAVPQYISVIERNSQQLLKLVDDILDVSKVEAGKLDFESIEFSLIELLMDFASVMSLKTKQKNIDFELKLATGVPTMVVGDPTRFRQVLNNIVGNAIKFTDQGYVHVFISYEVQTLKVMVVDSGKGISAKQAENLFKPFHQADVSTTRQFGGTGLGLVLARRLCEGMGGSFWLEKSEIDKGSSFIAEVILPAVDFSQNQLQSEFKVKGVSTGTNNLETVDLEGLRLLLVEDSPDLQELLALFLDRWKIKYEIASNGIDAIERIRSRGDTYDIVLMDIQMPEMDGHQAAREIRKMGFNKPMVALTAHAFEKERIKCLESGFSSYLSKPIQSDSLLSLLRTYHTR